MLGTQGLRRLLIAIIDAHQQRLIRSGSLCETKLLSAVLATPGADPAAKLVIGENDLGLDSLARLDLVMAVARYFNLQDTGVEDYLTVRRGLADWVDLVGWHLAQVGLDAKITFSSSGSTGPAKHITHARAVLDGEIDAVLQDPLRDLSSQGRVLSLVPAHHIYGFLWTVLLPERSARAAIEVPLGAPTAVFRHAQPGDLIVATPFGWETLAKCDLRLPEGLWGVSSGGPTTDKTWQAAQSIGLSRLIEVYGSSETGGLGWRIDAKAPFKLLPDITRQEGKLHRHAAPQQNLDIPDRLQWLEADRFFVKGRKDTVVQVAGENVNLGEWRRACLAQTGAEDVAIRLDDARLKAFVVTSGALQDKTEAAMHSFLSTLPAAARPDRIRYGTELPRAANGKLMDWDA